MWRTKLSKCCRERFDGSPDPLSRQGQTATQRGGLTPAQRVALVLLWLYKTALSPLLASGCKFYPTCSAYAQQAIQLYGVRRGAWLTLKRLLRCRPFSQGGIDPVPEPSGPANS